MRIAGKSVSKVTKQKGEVDVIVLRSCLAFRSKASRQLVVGVANVW